MTPIEYVTWMRGAAELCGSTPPSQEQWDMMRAKMLEAVGDLVAKRIFENAERYSEEQMRKEEAAKQYELQLAMYTQRMKTLQNRPVMFDPAHYGTITCDAGLSDLLVSTANQGYTGSALKYAAMTAEDLENKNK